MRVATIATPVHIILFREAIVISKLRARFTNCRRKKRITIRPSITACRAPGSINRLSVAAFFSLRKTSGSSLIVGAIGGPTCDLADRDAEHLLACDREGARGPH